MTKWFHKRVSARGAILSDILDWRPTPAGPLPPPPSPPVERPTTSPCSCCFPCNNHSNLLECRTTANTILINYSRSKVVQNYLGIWCCSDNKWIWNAWVKTSDLTFQLHICWEIFLWSHRWNWTKLDQKLREEIFRVWEVCIRPTKLALETANQFSPLAIKW